MILCTHALLQIVISSLQIWIILIFWHKNQNHSVFVHQNIQCWSNLGRLDPSGIWTVTIFPEFTSQLVIKMIEHTGNQSNHPLKSRQGKLLEEMKKASNVIFFFLTGLTVSRRLRRGVSEITSTASFWRPVQVLTFLLVSLWFFSVYKKTAHLVERETNFFDLLWQRLVSGPGTGLDGPASVGEAGTSWLGD